MPDTQKLRTAVRRFTFSSRPSSASASAECTVGDLNRVIDGIAKVLNAFIDELESDT